ncbi:MAG: alpha,alpha-trehalase [Solirubrobacteraceae bacterium]|jgi:GH15 family glucan-1,4-alpha-glucosidase|nr:alpha,alpha-trehalase [Solirubrobacteraceae bacterium]
MAFPAIADYAFLSDCHTGALVAPDGNVEWLCIPRFDAPSVFGMVLDRGAGGFRVAPYGEAHPVARRYEPGTMVLETTWMTPHGWAEVHDALTIGAWHEGDLMEAEHTRPPTDHEADHLLVRTVRCVQGEVMIEALCEPRFDYARGDATWTEVHHAAPAALDATDGTTTFRLLSDLRMGIEGQRVRARHKLREGETCYVALSWTEERGGPATAEQAFEHQARTAHFWRSWLESGTFPDHRWRNHLQRSALTLKGLTYAPTGALVAALTTSLPETPGGERNWDYRYSWMRDATFTLWALHALELDWEADDFMQYVADLARNEDGSLQIMYGIDGERDLTERTLDHLSGYEGARPVRIGNGAYDQRQNDVYGAVLDSMFLHTKEGGYIPQNLWPVLCDQADNAARVWREPDQGIWEARGAPRHYTSSKLMCWVAMDRASHLAKLRGDADRERAWGDVATEIRQDILENAVRDGVFRQHYETDALDASTLLVPLVRFLPPDDDRVRATVLAIAKDLSEHGLILRYRTEETDDGLHGEEGTFLICSFWLVSALSEIGEKARASALCERLLAVGSPLLLYGEELEADSGRHLGNYPQAFTHLALINAALHVIADEKGGQ